MLIQASHSSPMLMNQSPMLPTDAKVPLAGDDEPRPSLPISNHPSASNTTNTVDPSSMAVTALVFVLALFFLGFFSVFARRFIQGSDVSRHRSSPLPMNRYRPSSSSAGGLDPSAIRALPLLSYTDGMRRKAAVVAGCVVCLSEFEEEERVKVIPACGHVFHPGCIDAWLVSHGSCPVCRCSEMFTSGLRGGGEVCIKMIGGGEDDSDGDSEGFGFDEQGKVGVGLERRIRSWSWITEGERGTVLLRRTCSI